MASRLLGRLKRSLFKDGQGFEHEQDAGGGREQEEFNKDRWEVELEDEEECVTERLGGMLCFDNGEGRVEDGAEDDGSGMDSDSDFLGESMEEGISTDASPTGLSPGLSPTSLLTRQLQDSWRNLRQGGGGSPVPPGRRVTDNLLFEVTKASVVQDDGPKYVLYTVHVIQSSGSDKTPAIINRRYSEFQRLHATLRRNHGDQMEHVCFPRKRLHRNFTAETIAKRSRAFEQYLSHLCSLSALRRELCVRRFFCLTDLNAGQMFIRVGRYQDALGPLLNAKRLQQKLGWAVFYDSQAQAPPPDSSHWFFTLVGLSWCFQEEDQQEEARDHTDLALRVLTPADTQTATDDRPPPLSKPRPSTDAPQAHTDASWPSFNRPHPLLLPLLQAVVRQSWKTGKDKRQWEELLRPLEEQWARLDNQPTIKEFLVKFDLQENEVED